MAIGGENYAQILSKRFRILKNAFPGYPFADATYAGQFGLRKSSQFTYEPTVHPSTEKREFISAHMLKAPVEFMQTDYATFKTLFFLSQMFAQYSAELSNGAYLNLVDDSDASTPHVANGSALASLGELTFEDTPTEISLKAELAVKLYNDNFDWMLAHTTANTGSTGATASASGVSQITYDPSKFGIEGFYDMLIGTVSPTDSFGVRNQSKLSIKLTKQDDDEYMRPIIKSAVIDIETALLQSVIGNVQTIESYRNSDFVFKVPLRNGTTHVFNNCLSIVSIPDYSDEHTYLKVRLKGEIPFDALGTQANVVFDDATSTITWNLVGYSA